MVLELLLTLCELSSSLGWYKFVVTDEQYCQERHYQRHIVETDVEKLERQKQQCGNAKSLKRQGCRDSGWG